MTRATCLPTPIPQAAGVARIFGLGSPPLSEGVNEGGDEKIFARDPPFELGEGERVLDFSIVVRHWTYVSDYAVTQAKF